MSTLTKRRTDLLLCPVDGCRSFGRHKPGCVAEDCRGCLPRQAAPGLYLCDYHTFRIPADAMRCAELYGDLAEVLTAPERPGPHTTRTPDHGTILNEAAAEARLEIRHTLVAWCKLIAEVRGIGLPSTDHIDTLGGYVATHHQWLAAQPELSAACADELASLARRARLVAFPSGTRVFPVSSCPNPGCTATLRAILRDIDSLLPSELACNGHHDEGCECGACPPHRWPASMWRELGRRRFVTAAEIATDWAIPIGTVYALANTHRWRRTEDGRRPVLYLAADVFATRATQRATT